MKRIFGLVILVAALITLPISYLGCGSVTSVSGGDEDADNQADASIEEDGAQTEDAGTDSGGQSDAGEDGGVVEDGSTGDSGSDAGIDGGKTDAGTSDGGVKDGGVKDGGGSKDGGATACGDLPEGASTFKVDTLSRTVIVNYPANVDKGGPWPVIFNWHGLGDSASNMANIAKGYVNNTDFPFILVTPEDTNFSVSAMGYTVSTDWEVLDVDATANREGKLFDKMLACLKQKYSIDDNHIHSIGFSMGSIATDMLGTIRGAKLASTLTFSGAYFSDSANTATLGMFGSVVSWPAPNHSNGYAQVVLHGGTSDTYNLGGLLTVHFDTFATNDKGYLNGLGHDIVLCNHNNGHSAPQSDFQAPQIIEFFKAHPLGTVNSPWSSSGLPNDYPSYCTFSGKK